MDILILGGTGFLGPHLVDGARQRGHGVTLFTRGKTNAHLFPDVERLQGDRDGGLGALRGRAWDAAIDTSGYVPRLVRASAELLAPAVARYVFVSSISAYAEGVPPGADESAPLATVEDASTEQVREHYGALKALCEKAAEAAMPGRVAIVRPGLIVGPGDPTDRFTYWPVRLSRGGDVLAPGDGEDPVQIVDVRDLAAWMIELVERGTCGTFNAVGPAERLTMREMLAACAGVAAGTAGAAPRLHWADAAFLESQGVSPWSDMPAWIPSGPGSGLTSLSAARAIGAGLAFRPCADTCRDTLAWFATLPAERREQLRAGIAPGREAEVLAALGARARG